jgi:hypothetical protein
MEFNLTWILLGLPAAFVLGWLASRWDLRQVRADNRQAPKAYFKGLNFLLNEQQDKAIDAFIEAVQNDPDTTELHFALGNLFRRRGEYNRAVRVHEHLLSRADLTRPDRDRAQHALAQDFLKAGLLDRAEEALNRLEGTQYEGEARLALLAIYERSRDWAQAAAIVRKMQAAGQGTSAPGWPTIFAKTRNPRWPKASSTRRLRSCSRPWRLRRKLRAPDWSWPSSSIDRASPHRLCQVFRPGTEQPCPWRPACWWKWPRQRARSPRLAICCSSTMSRHPRWICCRHWSQSIRKAEMQEPRPPAPGATSGA